jgi:manganese efflux pump family protein
MNADFGIMQVLVGGLGVGLDNLAAALALGALGQRHRMWRIALTFAGFGAVTPLIGTIIGSSLSGPLAGYGQMAGALLLAAIGVWMIIESRKGVGISRDVAHRVTSRWGLLLLAASLSIDNLVVGFGLGLHGVPPLPLAGAAGAFVLVFSLVGLSLGDHVRRRWEQSSQLAAGLLLVALAAAIGSGLL